MTSGALTDNLLHAPPHEVNGPALVGISRKPAQHFCSQRAIESLKVCKMGGPPPGFPGGSGGTISVWACLSWADPALQE